MHVGFPDQTLTIEDLIADGDRVAARLASVGTHLGEFRGVPPSGNRITMEIFDIVLPGPSAPYKATSVASI